MGSSTLTVVVLALLLQLDANAAYNSYLEYTCRLALEPGVVMMGMPAELSDRRVRFERTDGTVLACGEQSVVHPGELLLAAISNMDDNTA